MSNLVTPAAPVQISNQEFLEGVFGRRWRDAHVTSFHGDPADGWWSGRRAGKARDLEDGTQNQYVAVSTFWDDPKTLRSRRVDALFHGMYALVVDDVGPKVKQEQVEKLPPPSWKLTTSPGNQQWGWILDMPELDWGRAKSMADGLVKNGLVEDKKDPGMVGVGRYVRMPRGTNWKPACGPSGFVEEFTEWHPDRRALPEELMVPFGVVLPEPGTVVPSQRGTSNATLDSGLLVRDPVFAAQADLGWIGEPRASGWGYECDCPCADEHTDGRDSGCAYRPGPGGAWACHHGHCRTAVLDAEGHVGVRPWYQFYEALDRALVDAGLAPMRRREFDPVDPEAPEVLEHAERALEVAARGPRRSAVARTILGDYVFSKPDNMFYSLGQRILVPRPAMNSVFAAGLGPDLVYRDKAGKEKHLPVDKWFFLQDGHQVVDGFTYWPGREAVFEHDGGMLANRWRPVEGLVDPGRRIATREVKPWLDLVKHVLGSEGPRALVWFLDWCAGVVAQPELKPGWMVVVQGEQGIGKDMIFRPIAAGVGEGNALEIDADTLGSGFTGYAEKRLVVVKELRQTTRGAATGHDQYNRLKWLVDPTARVLGVNPKYGRPFEARNVVAVAVTTNELDAVALDPADRRALVFVSSAGKWPAERYRRVLGWLDGLAGWEVVVWWLRQRWARMTQNRRAAVGGNAPRTAGRETMLRAAGGPVFAWVRKWIEADPTPDWPSVLSAGQVVGNVTRGLANPGSGLPRHLRAPSEDQAGKWLSQLGAARLANGQPVRSKKRGRVRLWAIRDADKFGTLGPAALAHLVDEDKINEFPGSQVVNYDFGGERKDLEGGSETEGEAGA